MDSAIEKFLADRKEKERKNKIKKNMTDNKKAETERNINQKFTLENWLPIASSKAKRRRLSTHPIKFSHPSNKVGETSSVVAAYSPNSDGFLRSGNAEAEIDSLGDAAAMDVQEFVELKLEDGQTVLEHIEQNSSLIQSLFNLGSLKYEELRDQFLLVKGSGDSPSTSSKIKQVYFPTDDDGHYHQLSILTPSGLVFSLRDRIDQIRFGEEAKASRELMKKNSHSESGHEEIYDLHVMKYGGANPQNISKLNSDFGGSSYLLPSCPPNLQRNYRKLPKIDFLRECIWPRQFNNHFKQLHALLCMNINNIQIRDKRDDIFLDIFDSIVQIVWDFRNESTGWTNNDLYSKLPQFQKHVLDQIYQKSSIDNELGHKYAESVELFLFHIARWIITSYMKVIGKDALELHDDEIQHVRKLFSQRKIL